MDQRWEIHTYTPAILRKEKRESYGLNYLASRNAPRNGDSVLLALGTAPLPPKGPVCEKRISLPHRAQAAGKRDPERPRVTRALRTPHGQTTGLKRNPPFRVWLRFCKSRVQDTQIQSGGHVSCNKYTPRVALRTSERRWKPPSSDSGQVGNPSVDASP